jgi:hypothetical protein
MKLTKRKLKQLIKEELNNVLGETWQPDPPPDLSQIATKISACVSSGGMQTIMTCGPYALELVRAIGQKTPDVFGAMNAARKLNNCVPETCKGAVTEIISVLGTMGVAVNL